jgi:predicted metal-dependent phosphotriesterase family hydrolase
LVDRLDVGRTGRVTGFVRTVLGDIDPAELGVTYAHEHLVIDGGRPVQLEPDFELPDVDLMVTEVGPAMELGLGAAIDAMPCDCGRSALKLGELSRRTGLHIVAPTGLTTTASMDRRIGRTSPISVTWWVKPTRQYSCADERAAVTPIWCEIGRTSRPTLHVRAVS